MSEWETFCDLCYYDLWRVRRKNERGYNDGYHLHNGEEARALVELLNGLERERDKLAEALKQCREDSVELLGERDWWRNEIRSDYQKRYQETRDNITRADEAIQSLTPNATIPCRKSNTHSPHRMEGGTK